MQGRRGPAAPGVPGAMDSPVPGHQDTRKDDMRGPGCCSAQSSLVSLEWLASWDKGYQEPLHDGRAGPFSRRTWGLPDPQGSPATRWEAEFQPGLSWGSQSSRDAACGPLHMAKVLPSASCAAAPRSHGRAPQGERGHRTRQSRAFPQLPGDDRLPAAHRPAQRQSIKPGGQCPVGWKMPEGSSSGQGNQRQGRVPGNAWRWLLRPHWLSRTRRKAPGMTATHFLSF